MTTLDLAEMTIKMDPKTIYCQTRRSFDGLKDVHIESHLFIGLHVLWCELERLLEFFHMLCCPRISQNCSTFSMDNLGMDYMD